MGIFTQAFDLLANPPGNLLYHLILVFSISSALQASFFHWRVTAFPQARRTLIGLIILIVLQVILFVTSALGWQEILNHSVFLPPLDRAITTISLVVLIWLWAFPEPNRNIDAITIIFSLLIVGGFVFSLVDWADPSSGTVYNATTQEFVWQAVSLGIIVLGFNLLVMRQPDNWGNGVAVLILVFIGHGLHMFLGLSEGNFPGILRVAYMAAFPILITLPQRFPIPKSAGLISIKQEQDAPVEERRHYSTDQKTFHALLALADETDSTKVNQAITRGIGQTMLADLCFLIYLSDDNNQMIFASGYDLIREETLEGLSVNKDVIPMLAKAIQRGQPLRLPASSTSTDIKGIAEILGLSNPGHMMTVPLITPEKESLGGILVLSPYSDRAWRAEDQAFLTNISPALLPIINRSERYEAIEQNHQKNEALINQSRDKINELLDQNKALQSQIRDAKKDIGKDPDQEKQIQSFLAMQQESQNQIEDLQQQLTQAKNTPLKDSKQEQQIASYLSMQQENQAKIEDLQKLLELAKNDSVKGADQQETIASLMAVQQENKIQINELQTQNKTLQARNEEKIGLTDGDTAAIRAELKAAKGQVANLEKEIAKAFTKIQTGGFNDEAKSIKTKLNTALSQVANLQNELTDSKTKLAQSGNGQKNVDNTEQTEVIASIAQDLRQPLSSVIGYADLLLGETIGILGSLQRKFIDRIKASSERIGTLVDDMIQVTNLETGLTSLKPESADLNTIIDNAMSYTSGQIREKGISFHLDLPKKLQSIYADPEALQQILIHLLQNAGAASPPEGKITLKVATQSENGKDYVMLRVTDTGGGISAEDIPRVFNRLYKADNVLIQGVGDTGVGLSIAKSLTEAQEGRIWVESETDKGASFSVLLPISAKA